MLLTFGHTLYSSNVGIKCCNFSTALLSHTVNEVNVLCYGFMHRCWGICKPQWVCQLHRKTDLVVLAVSSISHGSNAERFFISEYFSETSAAVFHHHLEKSSVSIETPWPDYHLLSSMLAVLSEFCLQKIQCPPWHTCTSCTGSCGQWSRLSGSSLHWTQCLV